MEDPTPDPTPATPPPPDPVSQLAMANMQLADAQKEVQALRQACFNLETTVRVLTRIVASQG